MEEIQLNNNDIIEQIKDFNHQEFTKELILNEKSKEYYKKLGLCKECKEPNTDIDWCNSCNPKNYQKNFKNWTSGNYDIDIFIQKTQLKAKNRDEIIQWIDYDKFEIIENLSKGSFGTIYKAIWKNQNNDYCPVALKCFYNSQDMTAELLKEVESHVLLNRSANIVHCYGITKNSKSNDFMMVMEYAENGSLRQYLNNNFNSLNWDQKLCNLLSIASGLKAIHNFGLIHNNLHCGNILSHLHKVTITDLGFCQPTNLKSSQSDNIKIHRVLPYVAPEVLRGEEYIQKSDIYSFGIIAHEICTGLTPYNDMNHEEFLDIKICQGLRPKSNYKIPQLILDIIEQCWDVNPSNRPKADELEHLLNELYLKIQQNSDLNEQFKEANVINLNQYRLNINDIETEFSGTF